MHFSSSKGGAASPDVACFYEADTGSWAYVASCPATGAAMIVDPVMNFDPAAAATWTAAADEIAAYVEDEGLSVEWVLDTHPHADHFSAAHYLAERFGSKTGIGEKVLKVQDIWADLYADESLKGRSDWWNRMFADGETFSLGNMEVKVMLSTGHTLASVSYLVGDAIFAHDTFMMPDSGTSRADFPGGSASELWETLQNILALPEDTRIFIGHDYCKGGRDPACEATVAEHLAGNVHVKRGSTREAFIETREERDATLALPDRMLHALQINLRGGRFPEPDAEGRRVLKVPFNRFDPR
ncbi:MBL fold metallo-hydrolase [Vannielia litorea]|uniref:MBL fold metallo-hydrolase n=1 Tax=Vannielia litorea TaxID=1217970 RepID=UPI001BCD8C8A|nr:MBL fold metallo-hydrolase [Vannielia litorea]MBS8228105.1 MBL fold metallo-hydrolase [Vannielia litorea]